MCQVGPRGTAGAQGKHECQDGNAPVYALIHGANGFAQGVRQHGDGARGRVHRARSTSGVVEQCHTRLHPVAHVGDVDAHLP